MNAVYILWLRQLKRYIRSRSRIFGSLGQPILFLIALGFGLGPTYAKANAGQNYLQFLAPGVIAMSILFTAIFTGMEVIWDKQFGFLKETLVAPISRFSIMLGRTLGGATVAVIQGVIVFLLSIIFGFRPIGFANSVISLVFMFLIALFFSALGTAIASRLNDMQGFPLVMNFLVMPIFFLSGALFPLTGLPQALAVIVKINPLSYGVDSIRGLLTGNMHFTLLTDFSVLIVLVLLLIGIGAYLFSRIEA